MNENWLSKRQETVHFGLPDGRHEYFHGIKASEKNSAVPQCQLN